MENDERSFTLSLSRGFHEAAVSLRRQPHTWASQMQPLFSHYTTGWDEVQAPAWMRSAWGWVR